MWRCSQAVQTTAQRWLRRNTSSQSVAQFARTHQQHYSVRLYNTATCNNTVFGQSSLLNQPSILSGSDSRPSLERYGGVRTNNSVTNPLLITCHAFSTRRPRAPMMKDLHSVDEVIVTAYEYLDVMSRRDISAVWARIALLMTKRQPRQQRKPSAAGELSFEDMEYMLYTIFDDTANGIKDCGAREITETTLGMAKIVKILRQKRRGEDSSRVILRRLLLSEEMKPNRELFRLLAGASMDKLDQFDARHLSNLAYAYALIDYVPEFLFEAIGDQVVAFKHLNEFKSQNLSNTVWAYATAGTPHPKLFEKVANHIVSLDSLDRFIPQNLSNIIWAYATAQVPNHKLLEKVANHIVESNSLVRFDPQALSNTVWAIATTNVPHPKLFEKVANHIVASDSLARFKPQDFSNTVWAYATADVHHPKLFEKVANHIVESKSLDRFKPQACSNIVWAYATAGISNPKLFEKVANHIVESDSLGRFIPQNLANIVWAYANAGIRHPKLFEKVANHIVSFRHLARFNSKDFSNTMWAYAKAGFNHPELFEKIANHIVPSDKMDQFNTQDFSNIMWAYATAQFPHPKLFKNAADAAIQRKGEFISQHIANLLWAYATMGIVDKQLFSSFVPTAAKLIDSCTNQELANVAWSYAVADVDAPTLFNDVFIKKCVEKKNAFKNEELRQLHQWHLLQTKEKSNSGLPVELQERCYNEFISEEPTVSKLQDDVVAQLSFIGLDPKEEVLMGSGYRIDALVEVNGKTIGVEVDGPHHFIGKGRSPLAKTILKRRQVPSIDGIELVSVPYWEWKKPGIDDVKKQEYLRHLLGLKSDNE